VCNHENSIGSLTSVKRICLDCGTNWIDDCVVSFTEEWKDYYDSQSTINWFRDALIKEQLVSQLFNNIL